MYTPLLDPTYVADPELDRALDETTPDPAIENEWNDYLDREGIPFRTGLEEPAVYVCTICDGDPFVGPVTHYSYSEIVDHNSGVHLVTAAAIVAGGAR